MSEMTWVMLHPDMTPEHLGFLPGMLNPDDPRPAKEQFDENYKYGGGWDAFKGFTMRDGGILTYPEDPPLHPRAFTRLRDELIMFYDHAWVAIVQKDGTFEVCRMD